MTAGNHLKNLVVEVLSGNAVPKSILLAEMSSKTATSQ